MPRMSGIEQAFCRSAPWRAFTRRVVLPWVLQGNAAQGDLLEIGGGGGAMAEQLLRAFPTTRLTLTDVDPKMISAGRGRLTPFPQATVRAADVTQLPFADGSFDIVASFLMLHHVIEWETALAEAFRVLRPGGILLGYDLLDTRTAEWIHRLDRSPHRLIKADELHPALADLGFGGVAVQYGLRRHVARFAARRPTPPAGNGFTPTGSSTVAGSTGLDTP